MDTKKARDRAMRQAYSHARDGHFHMAQAWITTANSYMAVGKQQLAYAQKLLDKARESVRETNGE